MRCLGEEYFKLCLFEYGSAIRMMGSNMIEFFSNLDGLQTYISSSDKFKSQIPPSSRCEYQHNKLTVHFYTSRSNMLEYYAGIVHGISHHLFAKESSVSVTRSNTPGSLHNFFTIDASDDRTSSQNCTLCSPQEYISEIPSDSKIGTGTFCKTFPFHFVVDKNLDIIQLGEALAKHVTITGSKSDRRVTSHFEFVRPTIEPFTYSALLSHVNFMFTLRTKVCDRHGKAQVSYQYLKFSSLGCFFLFSFYSYKAFFMDGNYYWYIVLFFFNIQ